MQNPMIIPDYSKLTLSQLNEVYGRLNKAANPQQAEALEGEITKRNERLKKYPNIKNITGAYSDVRFSEFGARFGAYLIDFFLFLIASIIVGVIILSAKIYSFIPPIIFVVVYNIIFHVFFTAKFGGSPGKLLCRIKVINKRGQYLNFRSSILRILPSTIFALLPLYSLHTLIETASHGASQQEVFWSVYPQALVMGNILQYAWVIDYCWFFFNKDKRALHDLIASSYVMPNDSRQIFLSHIERLKEERASSAENLIKTDSEQNKELL
ncbi:MAG TPA: RDD family protein [Ignavibacteriales bacterium]|nr:RDD family protein [Ignavibacteriales bacterium]